MEEILRARDQKSERWRRLAMAKGGCLQKTLTRMDIP
ncbi:hypothetical protein A2U01_0084641, partial [Trifolium medium]|nr:hypothetical protein [Trifolium medium]